MTLQEYQDLSTQPKVLIKVWHLSTKITPLLVQPILSVNSSLPEVIGVSRRRNKSFGENFKRKKKRAKVTMYLTF